MTVESAVALIVATFIFASIPGPGIAAMVVQAVARGFRTGAGFAVGLVCGDFVYLLLVLLGMGWIAPKIGPWFMVFKWAGAVYLVYLGVKYWIAKPPAELDAVTVKPQSVARTYLGGLCVSLGNPKVIAFYCGFLPGFVNIPELSGTDIIMVISMMLSTVLAVLLTYAWFASRGRRLMHSEKAWKIGSRTAGTAMIGAGMAVVAE